MEVQEIRAMPQAKAIADEWDKLAHLVDFPTPFSVPKWLTSWWRHIGQGQLLILAIFAHRALVGVLPMFIHDRKLMLLGAGTSDYLDGLFLPEYQMPAVAAAFDHLRPREAEWDVVELNQLRPESPLLSQDLPGNWSDELEFGERCPVLGLPDYPDQLHRVIPAHQWNKLNYYRHRASRAGAVEFVAASPGNFDELFDTFVRLHLMRLELQHKPTSLRQQNVQRFHREAARALLERGLLRLTVFKVNQRPAAAFYGFKAGRRTFFYLSGFDPALAQLSPGMLVIGQAIEAAVREGCSSFDFLRGQEPYKYKWGALDSLTCRRRLRPLCPEGVLKVAPSR
jgi:CelD/BcsL family acetyltransferase involved in cellulose biosynthesis